MNRIYYRLDMKLLTPLAIGSGANVNTDKDVIVDTSGKPFIPATSLAGVLRSYVASSYGQEVERGLFGYVSSIGKNSEDRDGKIIVYDGLMKASEKGYYITSRDMVKLEDRVAVDGAKFDMEAVEPDVRFTAYLELQDVKYSEQIEDALSAMDAGLIRLGTKTTRGYGQVSLSVSKQEFEDVEKWLNFDMMADDGWQKLQLQTANKCRTLRIRLKSEGAISIREYTTRPSGVSQTEPDYRALALHNSDDESKRTPVIPGTSWAGAFRHRFGEFVGDKAVLEDLFGYVNESDGTAKKSAIVFSESRLENGTYKVVTRNAIDRFTGGTKEGALYTEGTYYYGETDLLISFRRALNEKERKVMAACLADLHNGFLTIGGLTSVGRGMFTIDSIDGRKLSDSEKKPNVIYSALLKGGNWGE